MILLVDSRSIGYVSVTKDPKFVSGIVPLEFYHGDHYSSSVLMATLVSLLMHKSFALLKIPWRGTTQCVLVISYRLPYVGRIGWIVQ